MSDYQESEELQNPSENNEDQNQSTHKSSDPISTLISIIFTIFFDIFRVIGVCVLGIPDKSKEFLSDLEMAERYERWGEDQKEVQDFVTALRYCENTKDEDATKGEMLVRKYKVVFACLIAIMWNTLNEFRTSFYTKVNEYKFLLDDTISTKKELDKKIVEIKKLYREDSIFNAQETEVQAEKVRNQLNRLIYKRVAFIETNSFETSFKSAVESIEDLQNRLNHMIVRFNENEMVNDAQKQKTLFGVGERSENIKEQLNNFSPYQLRQQYTEAEEEECDENTFDLVDPVIKEDENGKTISFIAQEVEKEREEARKEAQNPNT